jgi:hypothetical protein
MITVAKSVLGLGAFAAASLVAATQSPLPPTVDVVVAKSDRAPIAEAWAPDCEVMLQKGEACVFQSTYGATAPRYMTIEKRSEPQTSTLVRMPVVDTASN